MPAGSKKGEHRGGRKKGTPNKANLLDRSVNQRMADMGYDPVDSMMLKALGKVPCGTCIDKDRNPTGRTRYKLPEGKHASDCMMSPDYRPSVPVERHKNGRLDIKFGCTCEGIGSRVCESCFGTLWERISVDTKLAADRELAKYKYPQLKSMEVTNPDGSMRPEWKVEIVRSPK